MNDEVKKLIKEEVEVAVDLLKDNLKGVKEDIKAEAVAEFKEELQVAKAEATAWYTKLPGWAKLLVVAAILGGLFAGERYFAAVPVAPAVVNVVVPAPAPAPSPIQGTQVVDKAAAERLDGSRLLAKVLRHQVVKQLQEDGLKTVGGDGKPLTKEAAVALANNLEDEHLIQIAQVSGQVPVDGKLLDTVTNVLSWILAHKDQIKRIVELIMMLLAAFA